MAFIRRSIFIVGSRVAMCQMCTVARSCAAIVEPQSNIEPFLRDFDRVARIYSNQQLDDEVASLTRSEFRTFLHQIGHVGDTDTIFDNLLQQSGSTATSISSSDMKRLYETDTYSRTKSTYSSGKLLQRYITSIYDNVKNAEEKESLGGDISAESFVTHVLQDKLHGLSSDSRQSMVNDVLAACNADSSGTISLQEASLCFFGEPSSTAQTPVRPAPGFALTTLLPTMASADDFISELERFTLKHPALNHHFLQSMSTGAYGAEKTAVLAATFLQAYHPFTQKFTHFLSATEQQMSIQEHQDILNENHDEESGIYHSEDYVMMRDIGLDPQLLENVPHKVLYTRCMDRLLNLTGAEPLPSKVAEDATKDLIHAFQVSSAAAPSSIAAMYFGSEFLVNSMYSQLVGSLRNDSRFAPQDLDFFLMHIEMDCEHARKMREIVAAHAQTEANRQMMLDTVLGILRARVSLYDKFVCHSFPPTGHGGVQTSKLYNAQSSNWARTQKNCLSDFTGRPPLFELCRPHVKDAAILDVGCGEGYAARVFTSMGASSVTGIDVSENMIDQAKLNGSSTESYYVANASNLGHFLRNNSASLEIVPGANLDQGSFDLATAIFVFNYTTISEMNDICAEIFDALKPGGHFVFSVPHPFMLSSHGDSVDNDTASQEQTFSFDGGDVDTRKYFSHRDRQFSGVIRCLDGRELNVKMCFKTFSDFFEAIRNAGFDLVDVLEARVTPEHMSEHPEFFESVNDKPLHLVFKVQKPLTSSTALDQTKALDSYASKIRWSSVDTENPERMLEANIPADALAELDKLVFQVMNQNMNSETYSPTADDINSLPKLAEFARLVRNRLCRETGAVLVRGLNLHTYVDHSDDHDGMVEKAKLAYFILCSLIGQVDGGARGRLFDVKNAQLSSKVDNVLFSVGSEEAGWHTDGASLNRVYDTIGLLCIQPASSGGELRISNSINALDKLKARFPPFILAELFRPIPRDILENGSGKGDENPLTNLSRQPDVLRLRAIQNAYPIFQEPADGRGDGIRFRYMRHWIETGHQKSGLPVSPLLQIAMDGLDDALDESQIWEGVLQPGEMIFCNNMLVPHARRAFEDGNGMHERHAVRAWIQTEKYCNKRN